MVPLGTNATPSSALARKDFIFFSSDHNFVFKTFSSCLVLKTVPSALAHHIKKQRAGFGEPNSDRFQGTSNLFGIMLK